MGKAQQNMEERMNDDSFNEQKTEGDITIKYNNSTPKSANPNSDIVEDVDFEEIE